MIILKVLGIIYALFFIPTFLLARFSENNGLLPVKVNKGNALWVFLTMWLIAPLAMPICFYRALKNSKGIKG